MRKILVQSLAVVLRTLAEIDSAQNSKKIGIFAMPGSRLTFSSMFNVICLVKRNSQ